jgi:hypothetical protein
LRIEEEKIREFKNKENEELEAKIAEMTRKHQEELQSIEEVFFLLFRTKSAYVWRSRVLKRNNTKSNSIFGNSRIRLWISTPSISKRRLSS